MDPGLSDLLTCPRCGPLYGLILLPEERRGRRVVRGVLGCANCRERYPVEAGVADLRVLETGRYSDSDGSDVVGGDSSEVPVGTSIWAVPGEEAVRLAALLGLDEARGTILIAGPAAAYAPAAAELSGDVTVVGAEAPESAPSFREDVSRVRAETVLPFRSGSLAAVALTGGYAGLIGEAVRVLTGGGRLLVEPAPTNVPGSWGDGVEVLAREGLAFLAARK